MKFIFLDIDGVLATYTNSPKYIGKDLFPPNGVLMFDTGCVSELNYLCNITKASIIVSSSWRYYIPNLEKMRQMLRLQGVNAPISGMTPLAQEDWIDSTRGAEIKRFLEPLEVESFVILDDCDMGFIGLEDQWVKTNSYLGLQLEDVKTAVKILL